MIPLENNLDSHCVPVLVGRYLHGTLNTRLMFGVDINTISDYRRKIVRPISLGVELALLEMDLIGRSYCAISELSKLR